jgi:hypothetical protein
MADHCRSLIAPVPESVTMLMNTYFAGRSRPEYPCFFMISLRISRVVGIVYSTALMR